MLKQAALMGFLATSAFAQTPEIVTVTCPIGGERFNIGVQQEKCSNDDERLMSFVPVSTCDLGTVVPQCPGNFLPMYKDFSEEDLEIIKEFIQSESYESSVDRSRFWLAYLIENQIGDPVVSSSFYLLMQALWYDPANFFTDEGLVREFLRKANADIAQERRLSGHGGGSSIYAILAFVNARIGETDQALLMLDLAGIRADSPPMLVNYDRAIRDCLADNSSIYCEPTTPIPHD